MGNKFEWFILEGKQILTTFATPEQQGFATRYFKEVGTLGQRGKFDGTPKRQRMGLVGQIIFTDFLGLPRPTPQKGFDGGWDFILNGVKYDVKMRSGTVDFRPNFAINFVEQQINYPCDIYVFGYCNRETWKFFFLGYLTKKEFIAKAKLYKEGEVRPNPKGGLPLLNPNREATFQDLKCLSEIFPTVRSEVK